MFPSTHDITPENFGYAVHTISLLLETGHPLLLVTKPHPFVIQEIDRLFSDKKDKILFRFTIGSKDKETLKFWEPNAPTFQERLMALQFAYFAGYITSVSCEPALDTNTAELIDEVLPYTTDAIWVGLPNRLKSILKLNGADDPETMVHANALMKAQSDEWVMELYNQYRENPKVKWKDSIKMIVGLARPTKAGLDL
jgi:DNA repair photolyase